MSRQEEQDLYARVKINADRIAYYASYLAGPATLDELHALDTLLSPTHDELMRRYTERMNANHPANDPTEDDLLEAQEYADIADMEAWHAANDPAKE